MSSILKTLKAAINVSKLVVKVLKLLAIVADKHISSLNQGSNSPFSKVVRVQIKAFHNRQKRASAVYLANKTGGKKRLNQGFNALISARR